MTAARNERSSSARRRRIRHLRRRIGSVLVTLLGPTALRLLARTWKVEIVGRENWEEARSRPGWIGTLWHGRMILGMPAYGNLRLRVLVSPSADGDLAAKLLRRFGYGMIRGSSNKSPARALREMLRELRQGGAIIITPDGPRGPRHSMNQGPAWMSRGTGFPVLPCGLACDRAWRMKSWDRFTIPKPGARIVIVFAEPLVVDRRTTEDGLEQATTEIQARMIRAEEEGFARLGCEKDW